MTLRRTLLALLAGALLIPASASAWSAPMVVPGSTGQATSAPHVLFTRTRGGALAVNGAGSDAEHRQVERFLLGTQPQTTWPGASGFDLTFGQLAAADRIIYEGTHDQRVQIAMAAGPSSDWKTYTRGPKTGGARVAVTAARGGTATAFSTFEAGSIGQVYLVLQNGTAAPGDSLTLSGRGHIRSVALARNADGDVLVAWDRSGTIESRLYSGTTRKLGAVQKLGTDREALKLTVALGDDRRAIVAWVDQAVSEGDASAGKLMATARTAHAGFAAPKQLDRYPVDVIPGGIALKAAYAGDQGILAFSASTGIKTSLVSGRSFAAPQSVGTQAPDPSWVLVGLGDLAVSPQGQAVVTWTARVDPANTQILASSFDGTAFGPATAVSAPGDLVSQPSAAFDPASNHAVLAWVDRTQEYVAKD